MEKQDFLSRQALAVRLESIEKQISMVREEMNGLNKRLKQAKVLPVASVKKLVLSGLLGMVLGSGGLWGLLQLL